MLKDALQDGFDDVEFDVGVRFGFSCQGKNVLEDRFKKLMR